MRDLIDRQAAIDAIKALWNDAPSAQHLSAMFDCEDAIRALPSAQQNLQPTCNNLATDAISRQAAIDALDCINGTEEVLRSLPSAQPEKTQLSEEDTTSDCISRHAAIDVIMDYPHGDVWNVENMDNMVCGIKALPSAQPDHWVPCSVTIDTPDHEVLCCDRHGEELIGWLSYIDDQWLCESDGEMMYDPVAWREKPEPYRGEGGE